MATVGVVEPPSVSAFSFLLATHIALGSLGIFMGPVAMFSRKVPGFHPRIGETYHWVMFGVCLTAGAMAILDWERLRMFLPIALGSYAFALVGYLAAKLRFSGWLRVHVIGQGGSYIAMMTALFVVNWEAVFMNQAGCPSGPGRFPRSSVRRLLLGSRERWR
jgi:hypothetical protein